MNATILGTILTLPAVAVQPRKPQLVVRVSLRSPEGSGVEYIRLRFRSELAEELFQRHVHTVCLVSGQILRTSNHLELWVTQQQQLPMDTAGVDGWVGITGLCKLPQGLGEVSTSAAGLPVWKAEVEVDHPEYGNTVHSYDPFSWSAVAFGPIVSQLSSSYVRPRQQILVEAGGLMYTQGGPARLVIREVRFPYPQFACGGAEGA